MTTTQTVPFHTLPEGAAFLYTGRYYVKKGERARPMEATRTVAIRCTALVYPMVG